MKGYTDTATVNQRRPLTPLMQDMLGRLVVGRLHVVMMSGVDKNVMKALVHRGMATWSLEFRGFSITDLGRAAFQKDSKS